MRRILFALLLASLLVSHVPSFAQDEPVTCPGFLPSRLIVGNKGRVTPGSSNNVRATPATDGEKLGQIPGEGVFTVLEGPNCNSDTAWWKVDYNGLVGWTVEGLDGEYWLEPLTADQVDETDASQEAEQAQFECKSDFAIGDQALLVNWAFASIQDQPGRAGKIVWQLEAENPFEILSEPVCEGENIWVQIEFDERLGWFLLVGGEEQCAEYGCSGPLLNAKHVPLPLETVVASDGSNLLLPDPAFQGKIAENAITAANVSQVETLQILGSGYAVDFAWSADESQLALVSSIRVDIYNLSNLKTPAYQLTEFNGAVKRVTYSPDNALLMVSDTSGTVSFWDTETYSLAGSVQHDSAIQDFVLDSTGQLLGVATQQSGWSLWNIQDVTAPDLLYQFPETLIDLQFAPDDSAVIGTNGGIVNAYQMQTGAVTTLVELGRGGGYSVDQFLITPDGSQLVVLVGGMIGDTMQSYSSYVTSWQLDTDKEVGNFSRQFAEFTSDYSKLARDMAVSPDSQAVVVTTANEQWLIKSLTSHRYQISNANKVEFSPDGSLIAFATDAGAIHLYAGTNFWDVLYGINGQIARLGFSPDGNYIAAQGVDNSFRVWKLETRQRIASMAYHPFFYNYLVAPDENHFLSTYGGDFWNLAAGNIEQSLKDIKYPLSFRDDGALITYVDNRQLGIYQLDASDQPEILDTGDGFSSFPSPTFSRDGTLIAWTTNGPEPAVQILDAYTGRVTQSIERYFEYIVDTTFSPDNSKLLVIDGRDIYRITIWDIASQQLLLVIPDQDRILTDVAYSPDAAKIAWLTFDMSSAEGEARYLIHVYDFSTHEEITINTPLLLHQLVINVDGMLVAGGDGSGVLQMWDMQSGEVLATLKGHNNRIAQLMFTQDGTRLFSSSADGTLRVWGLPVD